MLWSRDKHVDHSPFTQTILQPPDPEEGIGEPRELDRPAYERRPPKPPAEAAMEKLADPDGTPEDRSRWPADFKDNAWNRMGPPRPGWWWARHPWEGQEPTPVLLVMTDAGMRMDTEEGTFVRTSAYVWWGEPIEVPPFP